MRGPEHKPLPCVPFRPMRATIWGCRGSLATPGPSTVRYGGNTTSVELRTAADGLLILDAGTGIRSLGNALAGEHPSQIHLLLTHMHLDHVEGLGFFPALFDPECEITIWGPRQNAVSLRERIEAYLSPPWFPLEFEQLPSRIEFVEIWEDSWEMDGVRITTAPVRHPGPTVGYRIEENGTAFVFIPDNEPALERTSGVSIAAGADVLLHDAQYTGEEYTTRVGWGHTSLEDLAVFLAEAAPRRMLMFHHDPSHSDPTLEEMRTAAQELAERELELAHEGLQITLD